MEFDLSQLSTAIIALLGVVYVLYIAASVTREEMSIHDLRVNSHRLRNDYARKLAKMRGEYEEELVAVDIVPEAGEPTAQVAQEVTSAAKAA